MMASDTPVNTTTKVDLIPLPNEQSHELLMAVVGILSFFCVLGTVGNFLVLYVYVRKINKVASTVFIITLACTDFLTCVLIIPMTFVQVLYVSYNFQCTISCFHYDGYSCRQLNFGVYYRMSKLYTNGTSLYAQKHWLKVPQQENNDGIVFVPKSKWNYSESVYSLNITETSARGNRTKSVLMYDGICKPNGLIFNHSFTETYQKIYSMVVVILYIMVYRFVSLRRARRRRMHYQSSGYSSCKDHAATYLNTRASLNGCVKTELEPYSELEERPKSEKTEINRQMTIREKGLVANIRTAGMLFVVTALFIIVFLPAWLMAHQVIPYNILIFYMYFFYNVAHPIIYAFMNKAFRRDLKDVVECRLT
ncbi:hypothetical protein MAR_004425 [Mya arenaria]|uniref:G-protein coupled receptors family 1 profile domain-containing protein n=1 Tax=Mya arenaria TaxID=6604 RepID=A0ABY7EY89_MYAAR|nr:hypothetical protein MAR_004425 [Mya arenaria]